MGDQRQIAAAFFELAATAVEHHTACEQAEKDLARLARDILGANAYRLTDVEAVQLAQRVCNEIAEKAGASNV